MSDDGYSDTEIDPIDYESDEEELVDIEDKPLKEKIDPVLNTANKSRTVIMVPPDERVTSERLNLSEASQIISKRAKQIEDTGKAFTEIGNLHDAIPIAIKELLERRCPLILKRVIGHSPEGNPIVEFWDPKEMSFPELISEELGGFKRTKNKQNVSI